jgi:hypothetical protein
MKTWRLWICILPVLVSSLLLGCRASSAANETDDIYAALLKVVLQEVRKPAYIAFGKADPSDSFIERMAKEKLIIKKMSKAPEPFAMGRGAASRLKDPLFVIEPIKWLNSNKAEVDVNFVVAGKRYTIIRKNGQWVVASRKRTWIS